MWTKVGQAEAECGWQLGWGSARVTEPISGLPDVLALCLVTELLGWLRIAFRPGQEDAVSIDFRLEFGQSTLDLGTANRSPDPQLPRALTIQAHNSLSTARRECNFAILIKQPVDTARLTDGRFAIHPRSGLEDSRMQPSC